MNSELSCPGCGIHVEEVDFTKKFIFVEGVRYDAGCVWTFTCCGAQVLDSQTEFTADPHGNFYHSVLADGEGRVILSWLDTVEANDG